MSNLRLEAAAVKRKIESATAAVSNLQHSAERDIGNDLGHLRVALTASSKSIEGILRQHKRRHFSLALVQTNAKEAAALQQSFSNVTAGLEVATGYASQSHTKSQSYYLKALDLPNTHIKPARKSVQTLKGNLASATARLKSELDSTKKIRADAQRELERVSNDIAAKERSINASRVKASANDDEISRLKRQQKTIQEKRRARERRAAELRAEAENRRTKGKIVGWATLGIGLLYTAYQYDQATVNDINAGNEESQSRSLGLDLTRLQSSAASLQQESRELETQMTALKLSKDRLSSNLNVQNLRVSALETQMRSLNSEVKEAKTVLTQANNLDKSIDPISNQVSVLQHQMLDLKQKLDGLTANLEEKKDNAIFINKKTKKLALDKKGRNRLIEMLAESYGDLQGQLTEVERKWNQLTES